MELREGYIICSNATKEEILSNTTNEFKNYIFLSENELIKRLYGEVLPEALFLLMDEYSLGLEVAMEYIKYIPYLDKDSYDDLKLDSMVSARNLLIKHKLFKADMLFTVRLRQYPVTILDFYNEAIMPEVINKLEEYTTVYTIKRKKEPYKPICYCFKNAYLECLYVMNRINELHLNGVALKSIYILNMNDEYKFILKRLEREYNLPIAFPNERGILGFPIANEVFSLINDGKSFVEIINELDSNNLYFKEILNIIIRYNLRDKNPKDYIEFLKYTFKNMPIIADIYDDMISTSTKEAYKDSEYIFFLGCNLGDTPKIYKDEEYLNDRELNLINALSSIEKNRISKEALVSLFTQNKNVTISLKEMSGKDLCLPANILKELQIAIIDKAPELGINEIEDRIRLGIAYTRYSKYKIRDNDLSLKSDIKFNKYDNKFKGIDKSLLNKRLEEKPLKLAYSNLKTYYACPFAYYLDKILDLNEYKSSSATRLGTFAHRVLEESYNDDFDFNASVTSAMLDIRDDNEEYKDYFYMMQMKEVLSDLIDFNREHEEISELDSIKREVEIEYNGEDFTFLGFIDKLMYKEIGNDIYAAIIDYKTGKDRPSLDNVADGYNLQLPCYMFLLKSYPEFKNKNIHIIGIYLQKLNIIALDNTMDILEQRRKAFRLQGFTTTSIPDIVKLDPGFNKSDYIQSMSTKKDGSFGAYAKVIAPNKIEELIAKAKELIYKAAKGIHNAQFEIAPKKIDGYDRSCSFCKYKDICYKRYDDYIELEKNSFLKEED